MPSGVRKPTTTNEPGAFFFVPDHSAGTWGGDDGATGWASFGRKFGWRLWPQQSCQVVANESSAAFVKLKNLTYPPPEDVLGQVGVIPPHVLQNTTAPSDAEAGFSAEQAEFMTPQVGWRRRGL